jgi:hypothetical protein
MLEGLGRWRPRALVPMCHVLPAVSETHTNAELGMSDCDCSVVAAEDTWWANSTLLA